MKAVQLSFSKMKLQDVSRELFLEHEWKMPRGLADRSQSDPKNFTLEQWQQAKRIGKDPRAIKEALRDAWALSDSKTAFINALDERGYKLARGDRRGFVVVDHKGEIYSVSRWAGVKTKHVRERLGDESALRSVEEAKDLIARDMLQTLGRFQMELGETRQREKQNFEHRRIELVDRQRAGRETLNESVEQRQLVETQQRQARFRSGLKGLWDRLSGEHRRVVERNEFEAEEALRRDRTEKDQLIFRQLEQRQNLTQSHAHEHEGHTRQEREIRSDTQTYKEMQLPSREERLEAFKEQRRRRDGPEPHRTPEPVREPER